MKPATAPEESASEVRNGRRRLNWTAMGIAMALIINVSVLIWNAATLAGTARTTASTLAEVQREGTRQAQLRASADSALIAGLHWLDSRMTRIEVQLGLPTPPERRP